MMTPQQIAQQIEPLTLEERLGWISLNYPTTSFSTSFGKEDQAITHAIGSASLPLRVFTLDTGRLFEETHALAAITRERYHLEIQAFFPETQQVEALVTAKGPTSFYESVEARLECCRIRKVEPLRRALQGTAAWITGMRRGQSENRAHLPFAEWDAEHELVKIHPLLDWDDARLDAYLQAQNVPVNRLHAKGYPSIGCAPCTRPVPQGQDPRAGRWWWEDTTKKECGLHLHQGENA